MNLSRYLLITILPLSPASADVIDKDLPRIEQFLDLVERNSTTIKIVKSQARASEIKNEVERAKFATTSYLSSSISRSRKPATSPFAPEHTDSNQIGLGLAKLWRNGFKTNLDYTLANESISYPTRSDLNYQFPQLTASIETSLFRDLLSGKYSEFNEKIEKQNLAVMAEAKSKIKNVLASSLLLLVEAIELHDDIRLQQKLCRQIKAQSRKLKEKLDRKSIAERDWLLSLKNENICLAAVEEKKKSLHESEVKLKTDYSIEPEFYKSWPVESIFTQVSQLVSRYKLAKLKVEQTNEIRALDSQIRSMEHRQTELNANTRPDLQIKLSAGLSGIDDKFAAANEDIFQSRYPSLMLTAKLNFPLKNSVEVVTAITNQMEIENQRKRHAQLVLDSQSRVAVLRQSIKKDLLIYAKYRQNVQLSQKIINQANTDFDVGRINYNVLSEYQKGDTISRQQAARLRTRIIIQSIEFVDYFGYFDRFLTR